MGKMLTLLLIALLALGSLAGYLILTQKIIVGNLKIAAGQKQLKEGEQMLAQGKTKLAQGQEKMSRVKNINAEHKIIPLMTTVMLPVSAGVWILANNKISEGEQQIAKGKEKIKAGEKQLAEGQLELSRGIKRLSWANKIRIACAIGAIFFGSLLLALGFYWRRSLKQNRKSN